MRRIALLLAALAIAAPAKALTPQDVADLLHDTPRIVDAAPIGGCQLWERPQLVQRGAENEIMRLFVCVKGIWTDQSGSLFSSYLASPGSPYTAGYFDAIYGPFPQGIAPPFSYHLDLGSYTDSGANTILDLYSRGVLGGPYTHHADFTGDVQIGSGTLAIDVNGDGTLDYDLTDDETIFSGMILDSATGTIKSGLSVQNGFHFDGDEDGTYELYSLEEGLVVSFLNGYLYIDGDGDEFLEGNATKLYERLGIFYVDADGDGTPEAHFGGNDGVNVNGLTVAVGANPETVVGSSLGHAILFDASLTFDPDRDGTVEASMDSSGHLTTAAPAPDSHTGVAYYSDATAATYDTGTLVCTALGKTCVTTHLLNGTTAACSNDYNTGSPTAFYAVCR